MDVSASPETSRLATKPANRFVDRLISALGWLVLLTCCGVPLAWLGGQLIANPGLLIDAWPDAFRWRLIGRTFLYTALAATLATLIAVPVAATLGLSRYWWTRWLWWASAVPLLMPSLVVTYGWKQLHASLGGEPMPQSFADVARCIVALTSLLWPVPALVLALTLRRLDRDLLSYARLDGATGRTVIRLLAAPALVGWLGAMLLALQEFAVFEPTGISVIATEARAVFETGASLDQGWSMLSGHPTQAQRMGAALATMLPSLLLTLCLAMVGWRVARRLSADQDLSTGQGPSPLATPWWVDGLAMAVVLLGVGLPLGAMVASLRTSFDPARIANAYAPQLVGSMSLALAAAGVGGGLAVVASLVPLSSRAMGLAVASFLVGGQWTAIALIVAFNRPWLVDVYDGPAMPVIAYVGRFGFIALAAAAVTWSAGTRWLRELAHTDGSGRWATWRYVVAPLAWPVLACAIVLVFSLSLTEVPATTLLQPAQTLVPMLMTWAHILNYDAMIEASLLLAGAVIVASVGAVGLIRLMANREV
jgi:ABC-type Fe3+ transport system permease subunit